MRGRGVRRVAVGLAVALLLAGCSTKPEHPRGAWTPKAVPRPSATATTTTAPPPATRAEAPAAVTLVLNGDLLWHNTLWAGAREDARRAGRAGFDFAPTLAGIRPLVAGADVAICHLETPLAPAGGPYANYPRFSVPPSVVRGIAATGYDVCTTASNHSVDQGFAGLRRTLDALDRQGIAHNGTARTPAEAQRSTIVTTGTGIKVAVVSGTFGPGC